MIAFKLSISTKIFEYFRRYIFKSDRRGLAYRTRALNLFLASFEQLVLPIFPLRNPFPKNYLYFENFHFLADVLIPINWIDFFELAEVFLLENRFDYFGYLLYFSLLPF
jgi:hypothetical protein